MSRSVSAEGTTETPDLALMRVRLAQALGPEIGVGLAETRAGNPENLWPTERTSILAAVSKRQSEYAAGREAARQALAKIGHAPVAIPSAPDRSPIWPDQVVGSLAHTDDVCVAVAAWKRHTPALGIDMEPDQAMDDSLWPHICAPHELAALNTLPPGLKGRHATRLFCAKEAFYKWQYPQTGQLLEFHDVQIEIDPDCTGFRVEIDALLAARIATPAIPKGRLMNLNHAIIAVIGT